MGILGKGCGVSKKTLGAALATFGHADSKLAGSMLSAGTNRVGGAAAINRGLDHTVIGNSGNQIGREQLLNNADLFNQSITQRGTIKSADVGALAAWESNPVSNIMRGINPQTSLARQQGLVSGQNVFGW